MRRMAWTTVTTHDSTDLTDRLTAHPFKDAATSCTQPTPAAAPRSPAARLADLEDHGWSTTTSCPAS